MGCNNIWARALKLAAVVIAIPLCSIINMSLQTDQILLEWKSAIITPVLKNDNETQMENYRPISVLLIIAKIMECIGSTSCIAFYSNTHCPHSIILDSGLTTPPRMF